MEEINLGDVVHLNSEKHISMTVIEEDSDYVKCMYYDHVTGGFKTTGHIIKNAVTKV